jgi:hypothetical protein
LESEFYSESYGEDFLTIPKSIVQTGKIFYFSIYCQFKCTYEFEAFLEEEIKVQVGERSIFSLREGRSFILSFEHKKKFVQEIQFMSFTYKLSPFKMFISKNKSPSTQNSLPIIPSWMGGYYSSLTRESKDWCEDCTFYILLEAEKGSSEINFMVRYEDTIHKIKHFEPLYSTLKPQQMHCYSIDVDEKNKNENLIIETVLFSGSAQIAYNPWTNPIVDPNNFEKNVFKFKEDINIESINVITPEQRKYGRTGNDKLFIE